MTARIVEDKPIEALQVEYEATQEAVKTPLLTLLREVVGHIVQQEIMHSLLMRNIEALIKYDRFMDAWMRRVATGQ